MIGGCNNCNYPIEWAQENRYDSANDKPAPTCFPRVAKRFYGNSEAETQLNILDGLVRIAIGRHSVSSTDETNLASVNNLLF